MMVFPQNEKFLIGAIRNTIILYNVETFEETWRSYGELERNVHVQDLSWNTSVSV
jgi:hypothetical protein